MKRPAPMPPLALANRVCSVKRPGDPFEWYENLGAQTKAAILDLLPDGWDFDGRRVLDFGCGAGRTLRHFRDEAERAEIWGADVDAASVEWLRENLSPPFHVTRSGPEPPLGLDHGTFDLIWALSVFRHLTDSSLPWLLELHSLLKPGGLLIATYMGRWNGSAFTGEPWDEDRIGMNVLLHDHGWDVGGPVALMSDWWVREHWGRAFELCGELPEMHGQTWVLLRRREVSLSVEELARPGDDPREYAALRHNLRQLQRELVELRRCYERSRSWRVTRPLRAAGRLVRTLSRRP